MNRPGVDGRTPGVTNRILLQHLVACPTCRRSGPLHLVGDLVPPPRLRAEVLAAARPHRWRPRRPRRVRARLHRR